MAAKNTYLCRLVSIIILIIIAESQSPVCFWGRSSSNYLLTTLNGLYTFEQTYNGNPAYKKTMDSSCLFNGNPIGQYYLYKSGSNWLISRTLGSNSYNAICSSTSSDVTTCTGWQIPSTVDSNVYLISDSCPSWDCNTITTDIDTSFAPNTYSDLCKGPFTQIAPNAYSAVSSENGETYYWYFHPLFFEWRCAASYDLGCGASYTGYAEPGWTALSSGSNIDIDFTAAGKSTESNTVTCTGGSNIPSPTASPIAPSNTPAPVTPSPVTPSPVTPSPVTPSPITPSPVTPSPVTSGGNNTPAPVTPAPVTPAPVTSGGNDTPAPTTPSPSSGGNNAGSPSGDDSGIDRVITIYAFLMSMIIAFYV